MENEEKLKLEITELEESLKNQQRLLIKKREELRVLKSLEYIEAHDITIDKVHVTDDDPVFDYVHDNDKFDCLIRENIELPYLSDNGFIYQTNIVKSGKSKWDAKVPVKLSDLKQK